MTTAQPSVDGQLVQNELDELVCGPQNPSLWTTVEGMLQGPAEADFVRDTVGSQLLREIEGARDELRSLLSILSDLRGTNDSSLSSPARGAQSTSSPSRQYTTAGSPPEGANFKPHPPSVGLGQGVSLLQQRLKNLLENASEPSIESTFANPREKMVAQYVMNGSQRPASGAGKRPGTRGSLVSRGSSGGGAATATNNGGSRPFSAASHSQTGSGSSTSHFDPTANLQPIKAKLRFDAVHEVKDQLQELFENEKSLLLDDIELVRASIEEEMTWGMFTQPNKNEIVEMTTKLEEKQQVEEHQRTISALPTVRGGGGSAASLLRHRLPSLAHQQQQQQPEASGDGELGGGAVVESVSPTSRAPLVESIFATPPKAAPLAPLRVAAPKSEANLF